MACFEPRLRAECGRHAPAVFRGQMGAKGKVAVIVSRFFLVASLLVGVGIANGTSSAAGSLETRVWSYWDAIKSFDLATAYNLEEGARFKALSPLSFREQWSETDWELIEFQIVSVELSDSSAEVVVDLMFDVPQLSKNLARRITDHWVWREGEWLHASPVSNRGTASSDHTRAR